MISAASGLQEFATFVEIKKFHRKQQRLDQIWAFWENEPVVKMNMSQSFEKFFFTSSFPTHIESLRKRFLHENFVENITGICHGFDVQFLPIQEHRSVLTWTDFFLQRAWTFCSNPAFRVIKNVRLSDFFGKTDLHYGNKKLRTLLDIWKDKSQLRIKNQLF